MPPKQVYQVGIPVDYDAALTCTITVTGGNNDINVKVLDTAGKPIIEEPRLAGTNVVRVRVQRGHQYFLVLDNSFSTKTSKTVGIVCVATPLAEAKVESRPTGEGHAPRGAQLVTPTPTPTPVRPTPTPEPTPTPTPVRPTPTPEPTPTPTPVRPTPTPEPTPTPTPVRPTPTPEPTPTPTPVRPTPTPEPTPTPTPVRPTPTPEPTPTPTPVRPTPTPEPTPTPTPVRPTPTPEPTPTPTPVRPTPTPEPTPTPTPVRPTPTPEPTPTPTPVRPTPTPEPTPTPTPVRPTPTPEPTPTPTPVRPTPTPEPTPTPGLSAEELQYLSVVLGQSKRMQDSLQRLSDPLEQAQSDPYVIFTPAWRAKVAVELAIWKSTYEEARNLTPPPRFAAFHQTYVSALEQFSLAADDFAYGIDHLDARRISVAASRLEEGGRLLQEAMKQMPPH
ncbi:hypothetical protein NET03_04745 [Thermomicrobium sp. CFH 73360]|uniref:hypothetical protein n=1 Tax=Thermomicrobium sp. CFH 73360 TaxID=2951987 RepID=UPI0020772D72|nr:hypothetical protein [Thermomicrobium sp. CFH 73360]MCM8745831.1 hypothetical protein [Thermomicrobium sp. CFH 73360]